MIVGIITILACISIEVWDKDAVIGSIILSLVGLGLGVGSIASKGKGRDIAIIGIILNSLSLLISIGSA